MDEGRRTMSRLWISGTAKGKVRVLFGSAAVREKRKLARQIDRTIGKALRGELGESEKGDIARLWALADQLARSGAS
jgi:hypothetical protein